LEALFFNLRSPGTQLSTLHNTVGPTMPPKRKAAASCKAATPAARRQKTAQAAAAAAEPAEETTTVEVPGPRKDWLAPFHEMHVSRELTDAVLIVGDRSVAAHRVVLASVSPR
jgi:hypothetical protein